MRKLIILLLLWPVLLHAQTNEPTDITDPAGNTWAVGTYGWYFWSGFLTALAFFTVGVIKRMAQRVGGQTDF